MSNYFEIERKSKQGFEIQTCGRCGGSGRYSWNQMDGDRCYGCYGSGVVLTKRGAAARAYWVDMMEVFVSEIKVGWFMEVDRQFLKVQAIDWSDLNGGQCMLKTKKCTYCIKPDAVHEAVESVEEYHKLLKAAGEYQKFLTKAGNVAKRLESEVEDFTRSVLNQSTQTEVA